MTVTVSNGLESAQEIRKSLNELNIGYNNYGDCGFLVGPHPFMVSKDDLSNLYQQGKDFEEWLRTTIDLVNRACEDPELDWLAKIVEGSQSREVVEAHRKAHRSGVIRVPLFARPDMTELGRTVEVQTPGSGWGFQTAAHSIVGNKSHWIGPPGGFGKKK